VWGISITREYGIVLFHDVQILLFSLSELTYYFVNNKRTENGKLLYSLCDDLQIHTWSNESLLKVAGYERHYHKRICIEGIF
jgi:hypothetical protein